MAQGLDIVRHTVLDLLDHQAIAVTTVGAIVTAPPNHGGQVNFEITAVGADADETGDFLVEGRNGTDAFESAMLDDDGDDIATPGIRATQPGGVQNFTARVRPFEFYRLTATLAGTTPAFTVGAKLTLVDSTRPPATAQDPT